MDEFKEAKSSVELLQWIEELTHANICCNDIVFSDEYCGRLGAAMKRNPVLRKLELYYNDIEARGIKKICDALVGNTTLQCLALDRNLLRWTGAVHMADLLSGETRLLSLNLDRNEIGTRGAKALAKALRVNTSLRSLELYGNDIYNDGVESLADALTVNKTLQHLDLGSNGFGKRGADALHDALLINTTLYKLQLIGNDISQFTEMSLMSMLGGGYEREFIKAFDHSTTAAWRRCKLMVVGEGGAGKTAVVRSLLNHAFEPNWESTIGVDVQEAQAEPTGEVVKARQQHFARDLAHRIAAGLEVQNANSSDKQKSPEEPGGKNHRRSVQVVQASSVHKFEVVEDLEDTLKGRDVEPDELIQLRVSAAGAYRYDEKLVFKEVNERDSIRMAIWDYGGQRVFQTLHHLFLTSYGVYLLTFNMYSLLHDPETSVEHLVFWLKAIHVHADGAPVLLVGTNLDKTQEDGGEDSTVPAEKFPIAVENILTQKLSTYLEIMNIRRTPHFIYSPISNKTGEGIPEFREFLYVTVQEQKFVYKQVSVDWMRGLDLLLQQHENYLDYDVFRTILLDLGLNQADEVDAMLGLFHELGIIFYFNTTTFLRERIITEPQWLVTQLCKIIHDEELHSVINYDVLVQKGLAQDFDKMYSLGIISEDILELLWEPDQVAYLLDISQHLLLFSKWRVSRNEVAYIVPSMVADAPPNHDLVASDASYVCKFSFEVLPVGVFERLVCLCIAYCEDAEHSPEIYKNLARLWFAPTSCCILEASLDRNTIHAYVENGQHVAAMVLQVLDRMLKKLKQELMGKNFYWTVQVKSEETKNKFVALKAARKNKLSEWQATKPRGRVKVDKLLDNFY